MTEFKQRLINSRDRWADLKKSKIITIYGSYDNDVKEILLNLCEYFKNKGFLKTDIVENRETPIFNRQPLNTLNKSYYYIEISDLNLFLYFKNTDNQSVNLEANHALPKYLNRSLFFEEKEPFEAYGAIRTLAGDLLKSHGIKALPFNRNNIYKIAYKQIKSHYY